MNTYTLVPMTGSADTATTATTVARPDQPASDDSSGVSSVVVVIAVIAAALIGLVAGSLLSRSQRNGQSPSGAGAGSSGAPTPPDRPEPSTGDQQSPRPNTPTELQRMALVDALIDMRDRLAEENVSQSTRIGSVLTEAGVVTIDPTGEPFDPAKHQANPPPMPTDDLLADGRVAAVLKYGYIDRGRLLRLPIVVVYRHAPEIMP